MDPITIGLSMGILSNLAYDGLKQVRENTDSFLGSVTAEAAHNVADNEDQVTAGAIRDAFLEASVDTHDTSFTGDSDPEAIAAVSESLLATSELEEREEADRILQQYLRTVERQVAAKPSKGVPLLLEYAQRSTAQNEELLTRLDRLEDEFRDDLGQLERYTERAFEQEYTISGLDTHLHEEERRSLDEQLDAEHAVVVHGPAGVGKSGLLTAIGQDERTRRPVYFLNARRFSHVSSRRELQATLDVEHSVTDVLEEVGSSTGGCLLIVDQLDNIRGSGPDVVLQDLLLECASKGAIDVLTACRTWDLKENPQFQTLDEQFTNHQLTQLEPDRVRDVLTALGVDADPPSEIVSLGRNLLNLSIIGELVASEMNIDVTEIKSEVALWERYRESLLFRESTRAVDDATDVIERAVELATESLQRRQYDLQITNLSPAEERLVSSGVLENPHGNIYEFRHDQLRTYFYAWNRAESLTADFVSAIRDDEISEQDLGSIYRWIALLYNADTAGLAGDFLADVLDNERQLFPQLILIDELRSWDAEMCDESLVEELYTRLASRTALREYFFTTPGTESSWLTHVNHYGLNVTDEAVLEFCGRIAAENPTYAVNAILGIEQPDSETISEVCRIACKLPGDSQGAVLPSILSALGTRRRVDGTLEVRLCQLTKSLVESGEYRGAIQLVSRLLRPIPGTDEEAVQTRTTSRRSFLVNRVLPDLIQHRPTACLQLCEGFLRASVHIDDASTLETEDYDNFHQLSEAFDWQVPDETLFAATPRRLPDDQWFFPRDPVAKPVVDDTVELQTLFFYCLRDTLEQLFDDTPTEIHRCLLDRYLDDQPPFRRLAIHLLDENIEQYGSLVYDILTNAAWYRDPFVQPELRRLLHAAFPEFDTGEQAQILETIDAVAPIPIDVETAKWFTTETEALTTCQLQERYSNHWLLQQLAPLQAHLDQAHRDRLEQIKETDASNQFPTFRYEFDREIARFIARREREYGTGEGTFLPGASNRRQTEDGTYEIRTATEWKQLSPRQQLRLWRARAVDPDDDRPASAARTDRFTLTQYILNTIRDEPDRYLDHLDVIVNAESTYWGPVARSLTYHLEEGRLDWEATFEFCSAVISEQLARPPEQRADCQNIVQLACACDDITLRGRLCKILLRVTSSPALDASAEGLRNLITYHIWTDSFDSEPACSTSAIRATFLYAAQSAHQPYHRVLAERFPEIHEVDQSLAERLGVELFSENNSGPNVKLARSWIALLDNNQFDSIPVTTLQPYYDKLFATAISDTSHDSLSGLRKAICVHLCEGIGAGEFALDLDGILGQFYERTTAEYATLLASVSSVLERAGVLSTTEIVTIWQLRLKADIGPEPTPDELQWFAISVNFESIDDHDEMLSIIESSASKLVQTTTGLRPVLTYLLHFEDPSDALETLSPVTTVPPDSINYWFGRRGRLLLRQANSLEGEHRETAASIARNIVESGNFDFLEIAQELSRETT